YHGASPHGPPGHIEKLASDGSEGTCINYAQVRAECGEKESEQCTAGNVADEHEAPEARELREARTPRQHRQYRRGGLLGEQRRAAEHDKYEPYGIRRRQYSCRY